MAELRVACELEASKADLFKAVIYRIGCLDFQCDHLARQGHHGDLQASLEGRLWLLPAGLDFIADSWGSDSPKFDLICIPFHHL